MDHFQQGIIFYQNKDYAQARQHFEAAVYADPGNIGARHNLGLMCTMLGRNEDAILYLGPACQAGNAESYITRGTAHRNLGQYQQAMRDFAEAFLIDPGHATAYSNYGNMLRDAGRPDIALDFIKIANRLGPTNTSLLNESIAYLTLGDFAEGWKKYEYRWYYETGSSLKPELPGAEYDGTQDIAGHVVVVYHEQGFGDCIQYARYLTLLQESGASVVLLSKATLSSLMRHNYPGIDVRDWGSEIPAYHYHVALLDLPKCFGTTIDTIPSPGAYLRADDTVQAHWRGLMGARSRPRIGINWTSNNQAYIARFKRIDLDELISIVSDDFEFVNLCFDPSAAERDLLAQHGVKRYPYADFSELAGLISQLDAVVTVDTATAHLAGAIGVPTAILLPSYGCDWRWFLEREDSPFYESVRLFRKDGDSWAGALRRVKSCLPLSWRRP